jgi:hypothetical protein
MKWGYSYDQAEQIVDNTQSRGLMFSVMTSAEKAEVTKMLNHLSEKNQCTIVRRHDSIIIFGNEANVEKAFNYFSKSIDDIAKYNITRNY